MAAKIVYDNFQPTQRKPQPITGKLDFADENLDPGILDIEIERLMDLEEAGALNAKEQNKLSFLIQQKKDKTINDLLNKHEQGILNEQEQQDLNNLIEEKRLQPTSGIDYGYLEPKLLKADKAYAKDLSLIRPIVESSDDTGKLLQKKLIEKHYGPLGLTPHQDSSTGEWSAQYSDNSQHTLPGANLGEDIKRLGTSIAGGLLPNLIPGVGKGVAKLAGLAASRIAATGGIEGFIQQQQKADAINQAVKIGLLQPEEAKNLKKALLPVAFQTGATIGAIGGGIGEGIASLPGISKGIGQYLERAGTRGEAETATKKAIQEAYLEQQLRERAAADPYKGAAIMKNAVERNVDNYRLKADALFTEARESSKALKESGRASGEGFADITDWWNEFTDKFQGNDKIINEVADALGIVQTTPGRAGSTQVYSQPTRDPITGELLRSSLDFPATANAREIIDLGIPFQGPEIPGTGFTESLIQGSPTNLPTSSVRVPGSKTTTTIKPSNKDIITNEVQGTITPDNYLNGYEVLSKLADEAQLTDQRLYNQIVEAKVAYQKPLIKANAANQILEEGVEEGARQQTKAGFTTFKSTPKFPEKAKLFKPFLAIKQAYQVLEDGYTALPVKLRTKFSGTPQEVNDKVFKATGVLNLPTAQAKQVNQAVVNNYGNVAGERLKDIAESAIDQAVFRTKLLPIEPGAEGYLGSKITPELYEKASAMTPQQQKALQAKGVSLDFTKEAATAKAGAGEVSTKLDIKESKLLNQSQRDQEAFSSLVGPENYTEAQKPVRQLYNTQQTPAQPTTGIGKLKALLQDLGKPSAATDIGLGGALGVTAGGTLGGIAGALLPGKNIGLGAGIGAAAGGAAGGAIGANIRPIARAAGSTLLSEGTQSVLANPLLQAGARAATAAGIGAFTNPDEAENILQQILRTKKFTNGNY